MNAPRTVTLKSKAGGNVATRFVSQAGQVQRVVKDAERFLTEGHSIKNVSNASTKGFSSDLKHRTIYAVDGS